MISKKLRKKKEGRKKEKKKERKKERKFLSCIVGSDPTNFFLYF